MRVPFPAPGVPVPGRLGTTRRPAMPCAGSGRASSGAHPERALAPEGRGSGSRRTRTSSRKSGSHPVAAGPGAIASPTSMRRTASGARWSRTTSPEGPSWSPARRPATRPACSRQHSGRQGARTPSARVARTVFETGRRPPASTSQKKCRQQRSRLPARGEVARSGRPASGGTSYPRGAEATSGGPPSVRDLTPPAPRASTRRPRGTSPTTRACPSRT